MVSLEIKPPTKVSPLPVLTDCKGATLMEVLGTFLISKHLV
jgi:hypothetical protein